MAKINQDPTTTDPYESLRRPTLAGSSTTEEEIVVDPKMEALVEKQMLQEQIKAYKEQFFNMWLLRRTKLNPERANYFGMDTAKFGKEQYRGNLVVKGMLDDRMVVINELTGLIDSQNIAPQLQLIQDVYETVPGSGTVSPHIKELYAAGLGLDGISDEEATKLMKSEKYSLEKVAMDGDFLIKAQTALLDRSKKIGDIQENFGYSQMGIAGKISEFNYFAHKFIAGNIAAWGVKKVVGARSDMFVSAADLGLAQAIDTNGMRSMFVGKTTANQSRWAKFHRWFTRSSAQSRVIGQAGSYSEGYKLWQAATKELVQQGSAFKVDGGYQVAGQTFKGRKALEKATIHLLKTADDIGGVSYGNAFKSAGFLGSLRGWGRYVGKEAVMTVLGQRWGKATILGLGLTAHFMIQEKGGYSQVFSELGSKVREFTKGILGPIGILPNYDIALV